MNVELNEELNNPLQYDMLQEETLQNECRPKHENNVEGENAGDEDILIRIIAIQTQDDETRREQIAIRGEQLEIKILEAVLSYKLGEAMSTYLSVVGECYG